MFIDGSSYSDAARALASHEDPVDMAVAYVGSGAAEQLGGGHKATRILCDLLSGGTNPNEVAKIQALAGVQIRHVDNLHAKVMLAPSYALVGSANFSDNGVGWHDGMPGNLIEAGCRVTDDVQLDHIRTWFKRYWELSEEITADLLSQASINWARRQRGRPRPAGDRFIITPENWRSYTGRDTKLVIWRRRPTAEEIASEGELPDGLAPGTSSPNNPHWKKLDRYHEWGDLLNLGPGVVLLDVRYQPQGKVVCYGARRTLANGHQVRRGSRTIDVMEVISVIDGQRFETAERDQLASWLQPEIQRHYIRWCDELNPDHDEGGVVVDLDRVLKGAFGTAEGAHPSEFQQLFALASRISEPLGWRCVTVRSPGPEVRIGTGSKNLRRKETPALGRVNLRLSIRDGMVRCGSYLSPTKLAAYGTPLRLSGAEGRHWVQWPTESTAVLLARMLDETRDRLNGSDVDPESGPQKSLQRAGSPRSAV